MFSRKKTLGRSYTLTPQEERLEIVYYRRSIVTAETVEQDVKNIRDWLSSTNAGNYISETGKDDVLALIDYFTNTDPALRYGEKA